MEGLIIAFGCIITLVILTCGYILETQHDQLKEEIKELKDIIENKFRVQYIAKAAVVAEIRRLQLCTMDEHMNYYSAKAKTEYEVLEQLLISIDGLETKEL